MIENNSTCPRCAAMHDEVERVLRLISSAPGDAMSKRQLANDIDTVAEVCQEIIVRMGAAYGSPQDSRRHLQMLGEILEAHRMHYNAVSEPVPPPGR